MKTNRFILLIMLIVGIIQPYRLCAQLGKGGLPHSFSELSLRDSVQVIQMPEIDTDSLLRHDTINDFSFRFGYAIDVDLGMRNSGTWDTLFNGDKIWRLKIRSSGAYSINLIYDDFWLPEGAEFFVYSEDRGMILGAFTSNNNKPYRKFSTDLVKGDVIVLEYYEPVYASGGVINIDKVIHAYKNAFSGHGDSGNCNNDVTCYQGDDWCVEKRAVSMILVDNNTRWCSGCLINNVRQDLTPYYLTANHCLRGDENTWIFRFKYWSPTCNQGDDATHWVSISGAYVRARSSATDFALLELSVSPPSGMGVLYAGWDRTSVPPQSGAGIHHPRGDVMKISLYGNQIVSPFVNNTGVNSWLLHFDQGVVEPGSSGSPLFNQNHLVVGQLYGTTIANFITCNNPNGDAVYGRFDISWNSGLSGFLDPDGTGVTSIGPTSPTIYLINRTLTGFHKFAALEKMHIEGNVVTNGLPILCQPSNVLFTTEPGSYVEIKAKRVMIKSGVHLKVGSSVRIRAVSNINCNDNLVEGDYIDIFCNAGVSSRVSSSESNNSKNKILSESIKIEKTQPLFQSSDNIHLHPNPFKDKLTLTFPETDYISIQIVNLLGKEVYNYTFSERERIGTITLENLGDLPSGIYFVKVRGENFFEVRKIIKL